jgi:hypothetical protein
MLVSSSPILSVSDQPFAGDFRFAYHSWEFISLLIKKPLPYSQIMTRMDLVAVLLDVRYRQRVQKRLTRLRKRLLAFVIKSNPECFDHGGWLTPGFFPARIPPEAANLHGLMRRAECKLAMIRCHAECKLRNPDRPKQKARLRGVCSAHHRRDKRAFRSHLQGRLT